ncbi:hypothetical protein MOQ_002704 [Trypanosoma cruzi marinkellei]|uniref:Uncharacterized protein n=1 Tax=Trypanosoma cruzi marinkellei TaxID=85056 RepID=K2MDY2_TRYCR|nr:hypothetical protein MOQ_002704 [Trypanosoma cruzi marinkellei]
MTDAVRVVPVRDMQAYTNPHLNCQPVTMRGENLKCDAATALRASAFTGKNFDPGRNLKLFLEKEGADESEKLPRLPEKGKNDFISGHMEPPVSVGALASSHSNLGERLRHVELQCRTYHEQLQQVTMERDVLQEKVRAMDKQRLLGTSKIRELIEENKSLRAAFEEADVRLGIAEIEQQSLLTENQRLREHLILVQQHLGGEGRRVNCALQQGADNDGKSDLTTLGHFSESEIPQRQSDIVTQSANVESPDVVGDSFVDFPLAKAESIKQRDSQQETVADGSVKDQRHEDEQQDLRATNNYLEARCRVLETQLRRLRERLVSQELSTSPTNNHDK